MRKKIFIIIILVLVASVAVFALLRNQIEQAASNEETSQTRTNPPNQPSDTNVIQEGKEMSEGNLNTNISIKVGTESFSATLADNETARAFRDQLPITVGMSDVNGNEKAYDLPNALPSNHINPGRIQNGDLMLYGSRTLVLFYETFSTSYTYTRIGQVDDPANLADRLGSGDVEVTFQP